MRARVIAAVSLISIASVGLSAAQTDAPAEEFATVKARRIAHLQQELACVQGATSFETMRACMPSPPGGHRGPPPGEKP
jgi:hypothetical protein